MYIKKNLCWEGPFSRESPGAFLKGDFSFLNLQFSLFFFLPTLFLHLCLCLSSSVHSNIHPLSFSLQGYQIIVLSRSSHRIFPLLTHIHGKQTPRSDAFNENSDWNLVLCVGRKVCGPGADKCNVLSTIIWQGDEGFRGDVKRTEESLGRGAGEIPRWERNINPLVYWGKEKLSMVT